MDIAQKGLRSFLKITRKIYKNSTIIAFQPKSAINNNY